MGKLPFSWALNDKILNFCFLDILSCSKWIKKKQMLSYHTNSVFMVGGPMARVLLPPTAASLLGLFPTKYFL